MTDDVFVAAETLLRPWAQTNATPKPDRLEVMLAAADVSQALSALSQARWGYLSAITGLDLGAAANALEVLYHLCSGPAVLTLRVRLPRDHATLPSGCAAFPSASVLEREVSEMFGITFLHAPDTRRLFLPDDWPEGVYPLRKDAVVMERKE